MTMRDGGKPLAHRLYTGIAACLKGKDKKYA